MELQKATDRLWERIEKEDRYRDSLVLAACGWAEHHRRAVSGFYIGGID
jgi:hypothetical protein